VEDFSIVSLGAAFVYSKMMALTEDGLICRNKGCNDNVVFRKRNNYNKVKVTNYPTQKEYNNRRLL
jgi:hypothetical protein